jgi:TBC1 domain family protein 5
MENRNLLGIPLDIPTNMLASPTKRMRGPRPPSTSQIDPTIVRNHSRQASSPVGISEMFTRGLVERGESLGINKTFMSAVTEIRVGR